MEESSQIIPKNDIPTTSTVALTGNEILPSAAKLFINRKRQEGNPVIKYIRNVPYEWSSELKIDFECSKSCGILYLSLKYHKLHPGYIETRFSDASNYTIKILLLLVNVEDPSFLLRDLNLFCYRVGWSLILSYSVEEAAEYIENFRIYLNRNPETVINGIQQKRLQQQLGNRQQPTKEKNQLFFDQAIKLLSSIRMISQSDAKRLLGTYGSIQAIARAKQLDLENCSGLGPIKAQNIYNFFRTPFVTG